MSPQELTTAREEAGLSKTQLAAALGVAERTIYRYEKGETRIDGPVEIAIKSVLGTATSRTQRPSRKSKKSS